MVTTLNDGSVEVIIDTDDVERLVRDKLGNDVAEVFELTYRDKLTAEITETVRKEMTNDEDSLMAELDAYQDGMREIKDCTAKLMDMVIKDKRLSRDNLFKVLCEIRTELQNYDI